MSYGYMQSAAWPAGSGMQQAAQGQQQWYGQQAADGMQAAYNPPLQQPVQHQQQTQPPLPDEPPPPLPQEPPPPVPQQQQQTMQQQQPGLSMQLNNQQSYFQQQASSHPDQMVQMGQWGQGQYGQQQTWQGQGMGMQQGQIGQMPQQQWGYGNAMSTGLQQGMMGQQQGMMGQQQGMMGQPQWGNQYPMQQGYMQGQMQQGYMQYQQQQYPQQPQMMLQQYPQQQMSSMQQPMYGQQNMAQWQGAQQQYGGQQQWPQQQVPGQVPSMMQGRMLNTAPQQQMAGSSMGPQPTPPPRPTLPSPAASAPQATPVSQLQQHTPSPRPAAAPVAAPKPAPVPVAPPAPKVVDLKQLLTPPGRNQRPKRLLLIVRGLPGSGKSHVAKTIRQLELTHSGSAPRIHSIDDYFMVDVEREVAPDTPGSVRSAGSKRRVVIEQEYQHDAAMEVSYWKSLVRAVGKTLSGGDHSLVLLDAPAPKADQVKEAWLLGESAGYEVMVVDPLATDPQECHKQNAHRRSLADIEAMSKVFEAPPIMYTRASAVTLFKEEAPTSNPSDIDDVDMTVDVTVDAAGSSQQQQQQQAVPAATVTRSRWETEDDDEQQQQEQQDGLSGLVSAAAQRGRSSSSSPQNVGPEGPGDSSRPAKKPKLLAQLDNSDSGLDIDHEALLAGVNQVLEQLDADSDGAKAGELADDVGRGPRGLNTASSMSLGASYNSGSSKGGILKGSSTPGSVKKKVTWPDLPMADEQQQTGFSIAPIRRKQLEEVYWLDGLGPPKTLWLGGRVLTAGADGDYDNSDEEQQPQQHKASSGLNGMHHGSGMNSRHGSFADQVRAEHKSEHDLFRAVLLGQVTAAQAKTAGRL